MTLDLEWKTIKFGEISPPPDYLADLIRSFKPPFVISKTRDILTADSAKLLLSIHPPVVAEQKYQCICGSRILHLVTPFLLPEDRVTVGVLPGSTKRSELEDLVKKEHLLMQIAFSIHSPSTTLFGQSREYPMDELESFSPALSQNMASCAKLLGVTRQTLYNYLKAENEK